MTHEGAQQLLADIMAAIDDGVHVDQLVNQLAVKDIISSDDVTRITGSDESVQAEELCSVLLDKGEDFHPLVAKITETFERMKSAPSTTTSRNIQRSVESASPGVTDVQQRERRIRTYSEVSDDFPLKKFLLELSREITTEDLTAMKFMMRGETGFPVTVLEKLDSADKMFTKMMETGRLNSYNLQYLQALVQYTGRRDLNDRFREFALESQHKPIHLFIPDSGPENGFKYVKVHVEGDTEKLNYEAKEKLRADVARWLCCQPAYVFVRGIEPGHSLLFTFMVPEECVTGFINVYVTGNVSFGHLSVDVSINAQELSFSEKRAQSAMAAKPIFAHLRNLLEREHNLKQQLDTYSERLADLQEFDDTTVDQTCRDGSDRVHDDMYKSLFYKMLKLLETMQPKKHRFQPNGTGRTDEASTLKIASASALYRSLLFEAREKECDMDLVNKLMDTRAVLESSLSQERFRRMQVILDELIHEINDLAEENQMLRISGGSTFLQDVLAVQTQKRNAVIQQHIGQSHGIEINGFLGLQIVQRYDPVKFLLPPDIQQHLAAITNTLTKKERKKLKKALALSDAERSVVGANWPKLLEVAVFRELQRGTLEPVDKILERILAKIKRKDLVASLFPAVESQPQPPQATQSMRQKDGKVVPGKRCSSKT